MGSSSEALLLARVDDLARREGLLTAETGKARIYRDRIGGTVAWMPHGARRLELTLIQVRMRDEARANELHSLLVQSCDRTTADIPSHALGLDADVAVAHWAQLERDFFPAYLQAHREAQADRHRQV